MPVPTFIAHVNKRVFNPREIRRGKRPVVTHTGRVSGATYRTPLDAHAVDGGFVFFVMYGSRSDWVQNILHSGSALLDVEGESVKLTDPRLIGPDEASDVLPATVELPAGFWRVDEYLRMDIAE